MTTKDSPSILTAAQAEAPAPSPEPTPSKGNILTQWGHLVPGVAVSGLGIAIAMGLNKVLPAMSPMLMAIILGVLVRNLVPVPSIFESGLTFSAKRLLRVGVVLLGMQLVLGDILDLGAGMILVVAAVVLIGVFSGIFIGKALGMTKTQTLLISCGFSICGAAAVAAVDGVIDNDDDEETVTAVALVVLFGTLMIPLLPIMGHALGMDDRHIGLWAGASVHEVAQVVAIGGAVSAAALSVAVITKLARVLLMAPMMAGVSIMQRRSAAADPIPTGGKKPALIPAFILGFLAMVLIRSTGIVPEAVVSGTQIAQQALLGAAMFALGTGVKFSMFKKVGAKPFILAAILTVIVTTVGFAGVQIFG